MPWRPCDTATVEDGPASAMFGGFGVQGVGLGLDFFSRMWDDMVNVCVSEELGGEGFSVGPFCALSSAN